MSRLPESAMWSWFFFWPSCWVSTQWLSSSKWLARGGKRFRFVHFRALHSQCLPKTVLVTKVLVSRESPLPPCQLWPGLKSPVPRRWEPGPDRCPHPRVDCGWMIVVRTPRKENWWRLMRTNPIPVNLQRDWKRGCGRCEARGVFVEKKRMGGERAEPGDFLFFCIFVFC